jgi:hypothetical protein
MIVHYAAKGQVFFVKLDKESVKLVWPEGCQNGSRGTVTAKMTVQIYFT